MNGPDFASVPRSGLLPLLVEAQKSLGWLPDAELARISALCGLSKTEVLGVATFYSFFRLKPAGRHGIKVCVGTACHVKGAEAVFNAFREHLSLAPGEDTDTSGTWSLQKAACLGCCMLAPVVQIDGVTYGPVTAASIPGILKDFEGGRSNEGMRLRFTPPRVPEDTLYLCDCTSCRSAGALEVKAAVELYAGSHGRSLAVVTTGCTGVSSEAPVLELRRADGWTAAWSRVRPEYVVRLLDEVLEPDSFSRRLQRDLDRITDHILTRGEERKLPSRHRFERGAFNAGQVRIAMNDAETRNPLDYDAYLLSGGFRSLELCRSGIDRDEILGLLSVSGLRGRGGAGFLVHDKWCGAVRAVEGVKYVVCNGDEGDPGAFMDRLLLESSPFRVLEGMLAACYVVKPAEAFMYVRAEYPLAVQRARKAVKVLEERGVIGLASAVPEWRIPFTVVEGAGAFVCGEETALLESMEGMRGIPRLKPPYPTESGYLGKPTLVNNVETFANIPFLLLDPLSFRAFGTPSSTGTKTFALAGAVRNGGLVEVPLGITLRSIVNDLGGGVPSPARLKAVQIGGPSGGCLPENELDRKVDFDSLQASGAMMGSGGLIVLDDRTCMVETARYFTQFMAEESCGKCVYCRSGMVKMLSFLTRIVEGRGKLRDLKDLEVTALLVRERSLCGLGRSAANPVLSTLTHFRTEYEAHLAGTCPAGTCRKLARFIITGDCIGCGLCALNCPVGAIEFTPYEHHQIEVDRCTACGICRTICPKEAVIAAL